jgi:hypothetical protein
MVSVEVKGEEVTIRVLGHHRIWAVRSSIRFKRSNVQSATRVVGARKPPWRRCPGTYLPGFLCAGTYHAKEGKEFWDTTFRGNAIQIDLAGEAFTSLVVDVENPDEVIQLLTSRG